MYVSKELEPKYVSALSADLGHNQLESQRADKWVNPKGMADGDKVAENFVKNSSSVIYPP